MSAADIEREYQRAVDRLLESETTIKAMFNSGISIGHWLRILAMSSEQQASLEHDPE